MLYLFLYLLYKFYKNNYLILFPVILIIVSVFVLGSQIWVCFLAIYSELGLI